MGLISDARLDAKAFRENAVYNSEGDAIRFGANADRLDQYADALEKLRGYAKHGPMCLTLGKHDCRCGLTDLLKDIGE